MAREDTGYILDASALLALMYGETGEATVRQMLPNAYIHSVNVAEVVRKLVREGIPDQEAQAMIEDLGIEVEDTFGFQQAALVGKFLGTTAHDLGLSLGDGVCLVMGLFSGSTVVTADRVWAKFHGKRFGGKKFQIHLIR